MREYYDRRAPEYDDWYLGRDLFADRDRPGWEEELAQLSGVIAALPAARTLDVACGTGFLTRHLRGDTVGLDQSARMLAEAARRVPGATFVEGDAFAMPFPDGSFDRVFTGHFYGHLTEPAPLRFLDEARRLAPELIAVDASRAGSQVDDEMSRRVLEDGSRWQVYKRWFGGAALAAELGGGEVLYEGRWFVVVRATLYAWPLGGSSRAVAASEVSA